MIALTGACRPFRQRCEVFSFEDSLGVRPNGPFDCLTWADGADGPGYVNGWAFGQESHEELLGKYFTALTVGPETFYPQSKIPTSPQVFQFSV